ncbi:MAG TPA: SpoIID/LytB domain-containing protein [Candidatus Magasanikbacteria bacterium]|nr:SpoIID/LytB domain-containing protein [Candidatus Magasanikbacteria bacterium]
MFFSLIKRVSIGMSILAVCLGTTAIVQAADPKLTIKDSAYAVKFVSQSIPDPVQMEAGEIKTVTFKFKNIGTATWTGSRFISAYTMEPRYHDSVFKGSNWISSSQSAKIEGTIKPGEVGELKLELKAPETSGEYKEEFYLAAENHTWVKGGYFFIDISVVPKKQVAVTTETTTTPAPTATVSQSTYQATRIILSKKQIEARGGETVPVIIGFQNTGTNPWTSYTLKSTAVNVENRAGTPKVLVEKQAVVSPSGIARETISLPIPERKGMYTMRLALVPNGIEKASDLGTVTVTVTEDATTITEEEYTESVQPLVRFLEEPRIRVGVWKNPEKGVEFVSSDETYTVFDGDTTMGTIPPGTRVSMWQTKGMFYFKGADIEYSTGNFIRLVPANNPHAVFRLANFERLVTYRGKQSFNAYRGAMEYRATKNNDAVYVVNDILFEDYIAGIAETSNEAHMEYMKAILTAARTYGYYMQNHPSTQGKIFDVVATTADQLYLGYESEVLLPRVVEAAQATRGMMITYDTDANADTMSEIVMTPYFANADTRTRSWSEVWGGAGRPWLVSVPTEYDKRDKKKLYGHGVGMSARDASIRASEKGENFEQLLKYYYTGVGLEKMYQ